MNKKLIVIFLALLVLGMSVAVAADADDSTSTTKKVTKDTNKIVKNTAVTKKAIKAVDTKTTSKAKDATKKVINKTDEQNTKTVTKKTNVKNVKTCIGIDNSNFDTYFKSTGFESNVLDGECFTFTENIVRNCSYVVDKAVNINGNGNRIELNTVSGDYNGTESGNSFNITGSYINITNLKFYNSQVFVKNAHHVTMDNINVTVKNQRIGSGVGVTSIRENSSYITVKNSYFYTCNNSGSSTLVIADADYCTIDNNTITGEGNVGNLMYLTTYNIPGVSYTNVNINTYNNITNNRISAINLTGGVCVGVVVSGHSNKFEGNNVSVASSFSGQWISPYANLTGDFNDTYEGNSYINNDIYGSFTGTKNSTITGNTFHSSVSLPERCIFKNNNAENSTVTVKGKNCDLCGNTINTLVVSAYPVYVCTDNIFTNYPTDPNISWYTHGSRSDTLNKNYLRSVKTSSVTDEIEYNEVDIDDEETFLKYFRYQESGGLYLPIATYITGNTRYKLGYFPENGKMLYFMSNMLGQYMQSHFSIVGKDGFTLNNVGLYIIGIHVSISNLNLNYNLEDEENPVNPIHCQSMGMAAVTDAYVEFDHLNITLKSVYKASTFLFNLNPAQVNDNDIIQNSIINVEVPAGSYNIINNKASNVTILNNTINVKETYAADENPIIAINGLDSTNVTCIGNTITMNGKSILTAIKLDGNNNTIKDNIILVTSTKSTATGVELTGNDNTVIDNIICANDVTGNDAVVVTSENNVVQDNTGLIETGLTVINPSVVNVNEISPMTVILKDANGNLLANQEINVTVGDEFETITTDASGIAVYDFLPTTSGSADIVFNYLGGGKFLSSNKTVTVTVNEDKDAIIEELNKTIQEQKETIASQEEDIEDLNKIIEEQDDEIESLTNTTQALNNTVAQLEKDIKDVQEQIANNNNTNNANGTSNKTSTPTKTSVTLKLKPTTIYTGSKTKITATLKDANGKAVASQKISIKVGTKTYTVKTNNKGVATKTVKVTKTGKNKVTATFKATKKYAKATKTSTLTVKAKQKTKITVTKLSYKNKKITIKATIKAGKKALTQNTKLTIKVDGKTLTAKKTSKKGKITLTLKKTLKKGSHKVQIISKATSMYKQAKVTKTLKV